MVLKSAMFDQVYSNLKDKTDDELFKLMMELNEKNMIAPPHLRHLINTNLQLVTEEYQRRKDK